MSTVYAAPRDDGPNQVLEGPDSPVVETRTEYPSASAAEDATALKGGGATDDGSAKCTARLLSSLEERFAALEAREKKRAEEDKPNAFQARIGTGLTALSLVIFTVQSNVWCAAKCVMRHPRRDEGIAGQIATWGTAINAVAISVVARFVFGVKLVATFCFYVVWFTSFAVLGHLLGRAEKRAKRNGEDGDAARAAFRASLFRVFGVEVRSLNKSYEGLALFLLASLVPAIVAGFLARWFSEEKYEISCSAEWTEDVDGKISCTTVDGEFVCCRSHDDTFNYFKFMAFLSGNVLGAYQIVEKGAICILATARVGGTVEEDQDIADVPVPRREKCRPVR